MLASLQSFVSNNAQRVHKRFTGMRLINELCTVPASYGDVVPMAAGQSIRWRGWFNRSKPTRGPMSTTQVNTPTSRLRLGYARRATSRRP